jgi:hypothetical protein
MISRIIFGSDILDTPPSALISAGTRSRAMTATAPASSAILALPEDVSWTASSMKEECELVRR